MSGDNVTKRPLTLPQQGLKPCLLGLGDFRFFSVVTQKSQPSPRRQTLMASVSVLCSVSWQLFLLWARVGSGPIDNIVIRTCEL